jgi:hypothetical protein
VNEWTDQLGFSTGVCVRGLEVALKRPGVQPHQVSVQRMNRPFLLLDHIGELLRRGRATLRAALAHSDDLLSQRSMAVSSCDAVSPSSIHEAPSASVLSTPALNLS